MRRILIFLSIIVSFSNSYSQKGMKMIAHYPFNGNVNDTSAFKNHGKIVGTIKPTLNRFSEPDKAMQFSNNSYIMVPHSKSMDNIKDSLTITAWAKLDCTNNFWFTLLCKSDKDWEDRDSPHFRFQITKTSMALCSEVVGNYVYDFKPGEWYFMAVSFSGKKLRFYVNGLLMLDTTINYQLMPNQYPLIIGFDPPGKHEYFCGSIDDLRIFSNILTTNQIHNIMNSVDIFSNTLFKKDTIILTDTIRKRITYSDSIKVTVFDTIYQSIVDTLYNTYNKIDTLYRTIYKTDTIIEKTSRKDFSDLPKTFDHKPIQYQNVVQVSSRNITIIAFDDATEDRDSVSININGIWVKKKYPIKYKSNLKESDLIEITLISPTENYLITKAISEGTVPPCTLCLSISDGISKPQLVKIHCTKDYMGGLKIIYKPSDSDQ